MKLSDLLQQAKGAYQQYANSPFGGIASKIVSGGIDQVSALQNSINKSSPGFKQTTTTQSGVPVASDVKTAPTVPTPEPIDWYSEYAHRALQGDTNAQDWMEKNYIDETQPTNDSSIDFSTPTSDVAYGAEQMNKIYGSRTPEELWALRQQLRINQAEQAQGWDQTQVDPNQPVQSLNDIRELLARQRSDAASGMLPNEGMDYRLPGMAGTPGYTFGDIQAINKSKADIFGTQISALDQFVDDYSKGQKADGGLSFGGMEPWQQSIINATSVGSTKDERNANRQDLIMAASQGADAFVQALIGKGEANLKGTQLDEFNSRITNISALQAALSSLESSGVKLSNFLSVKNKAEQIFGKQSTEYAAVQMLFEQVSASERNKIFGASLTGNEQAAANKFVINDKDTNETAVMKANKMIGVMNYANDIAALKATGATRQKIKEWQDAGYLKTFDEYTGTPSSTGTSSGISDAEKEQLKRQGYSDAEINGLLGFKQVDGGTNTAIGGLPDAMKRIARNESPSGNYREIGPVVTSGQYKGQRALGLYQVMPGNIPAWSKEALGYSVTPQQFLNSPQLQEKIVAHQMTQAYKKYGNWNDVASVWFTGRPLAQGRNASDVLGTSGSEYVRRFNA